MSKLENDLLSQVGWIKLPPPEREYKFCPTRRWRADFAWPDYKVIVEVEGGIYKNGRHVRGKGFEADCEKYNWATLEGWKVIRVTAKHIKTGQALNWIEEILKDDNERIYK